MNGLTIGHMAEQAGVNLQTIRYYQRRGLIDVPAKPAQGYRRYAPSTVDRVRFIKQAQRLGFTLKEIRELLDLGDGHCEDVQAMAQAKREKIHRQIGELRNMQRALDRYLAQCRENRAPGHCSMIEALYGNSG